MRGSNAVDFWRGYALVTIFINHIPGIYFERFTHRNVSFSDSAELFVFLAGWSLRYVADRPAAPVPASLLPARLAGRALTIYAAHILTVSLAIAMLATAAAISSNPLILEWHNAAAVFHDPVQVHIGLVLLTHQLGYFDILPLYVVLMILAPGIALLDRWAPRWLLPLPLVVLSRRAGVSRHAAELAGERRVVFQPLGLATRVRPRVCPG
ncbi:MAG: OpgC domain-containing protein [Hyphomicrobiaceae bacterium]